MENYKKDNPDNILESLATGVVAVDLEGKITTFNRAAEGITGLVSETVTGKEFDEIFGPDFFHNSNLTYRSIRDIHKSMEIGTEICTNDNDSLHISLSISPVKGPGNEKEGIVLTLHDVTRIKKLEEQANRNGHLAAMGEMAAKIAHEIRNPLGSIELFATALMKDLEGSGELKALAGHISSGVKSINSIISNLVLFIRPEQKADFKIIDIYDSLNDSLFFFGHLIKSNDSIEVITDYSPESLIIYGDSELLKQVYLNLILNAIQAMPDGGKLTVSTKKCRDQQTNSHFLEIRCSDTGEGISKANTSRVFDPFFTTKKKGTGLGLPIVHSIIKLHGGTIDINSTEGKGTVCTVILPLWDGERPTNVCAMGYEMFDRESQYTNPGSQIIDGA